MFATDELMEEYLMMIKGEIERWMKQKQKEYMIKMDFDFLSAKTGDNIQHVFTKVGRYVWDYRET